MLLGAFWNIKVLGIVKGVLLMFFRMYRGKTVEKIIDLSPKHAQKPFYVRTNTSDLEIVKGIFIGKNGNGEYGDIFLKKYRDYLMNATTIVDLGANIGAFTYWCDMINPNIEKMIAVEPEKNNYIMLSKNMPKKCVAYNAGIWNKRCGLNVISRGTGEWGFIVKEAQHERAADVQAIDMNYIIRENEIEIIDILKVDIEGSEYEVFSDNYDWISKIRMLVIETHDRFKPGSEKIVVNCMQKFGFDYEKIGEDLVFTVKSMIKRDL